MFGAEEAWRRDGKYFVGAQGHWPYEEESSTVAWVEHQFMEDFSVLEFDSVDFEDEHLALLNERNGQWLDESQNISLWLSQGCYHSRKCLISDMARCDNVYMEYLPFGFTHDKPKDMIPINRNEPELLEEYRLPVGAEVNLFCQEDHQKITIDIDANPHDKLMTIKCLPNFKYDLPREDFPKCRSYCPAPARLMTEARMREDLLPLQLLYARDPTLAMKPATHPDVGYRVLAPPGYSGLRLDRDLTDVNTEYWDGEKIFYICKNESLGVKKRDEVSVGFRCRSDGIFGVPEPNFWPECDVKTTTAKTAIVDGVKMSMHFQDEDLAYRMFWREYLLAQAKWDKGNLFWKVTVPAAGIILLIIISCMCCMKYDSVCCEVCNRDYEVKQMQHYGDNSYVYNNSY